METNPAKRAYIKYMNTRISNANKPAEPVSKGIMGMSRTQPEEKKKTKQPMERAQEMFNQVRDQRKKLQNGRT
jgi:hypothetical protein